LAGNRRIRSDFGGFELVRRKNTAAAQSAQSDAQNGSIMRGWKLALLLAIFCTACNSRDGSRRLTPERAAEVSREVQEFAAMAAHDVTQDGPAAWRKHFSGSPTFFMAVEGKLQFADSASAAAGIQELTRTMMHLELKWSDVRVDPLTPELAGMGARWNEAIEMTDGKRVDSGGYFTGIAERRNGHWQFRNAHWSVAPAAAAL
jgi:hypothetical protein